MKLSLTNVPAESVEEAARVYAVDAANDNRWRRKLAPKYTGYSEHYNPRFNEEAVAAHINSFNNFIDTLKIMVSYVAPCVVTISPSRVLRVELTDITLKPPPFTPIMAREMKATYAGEMSITVRVSEGTISKMILINLGEVPIMVGSKLCYLHGKTPMERIALHEDERDAGGYFISSGQEKVMRFHIDCLSNTPLALTKFWSLSSKNSLAPFAVHYKGVREDGHVCATVIQAQRNNMLSMRFKITTRYTYIPLMFVLHALISTTDKEIYDTICTMCTMPGSKENGYVSLRVEAMLRDFHTYRIFSRDTCRRFLGGRFRLLMNYTYRTDLSDEECCDIAFDEYVLINIPKEDKRSKFTTLCLMARKCLLLLGGFIKPDNPDLLHCQEVISPGAFFKMVTVTSLNRGMNLIAHRASNAEAVGSYEFSNVWIARNLTNRGIWRFVSSALRSLAGTGIVRTPPGHDYCNLVGITVMADKINYVRFLAHFRSINRGSAFAHHKLTSIRKLYPESYGFQCAVHTPDGAPCGMLTHLCYKATVLNVEPSPNDMDRFLLFFTTFGLSPSLTEEYNLPVMLNSRIVGYLDTNERMEALAMKLRAAKVSGTIFPYSEIICIRRGNDNGFFPGLYVNTTLGRFYRPVYSLTSGATEHITPWEQIFFHIAVYGEEVRPSITTHQEIAPTSFLSILGLLVPFSDHNQSPRNMYECQMLKQTMAIPCRNLSYRYDAKMYVLTTPQRPIVRNAIIYNSGGFDTHPTGTNLVVAVCAYTSYDMEDAALINKASLERGLFHGTVYSTHDIDCYEHSLARLDRTSVDTLPYLKRSPDYLSLIETEYDTELDEDGLPPIGAYLSSGCVFYQLYDPTKQNYIVSRYYHEPGFVERILVIQRGGSYYDDSSAPLAKSRASEPANGQGSKATVSSESSKESEYTKSDESSSEAGNVPEADSRHSLKTISTDVDDMPRELTVKDTWNSRKLKTTHFIQRVRIIVRHDRTPVVGDKVASRHGQKGIIGIRWRQTDMPFTTSGIVPDLMINPHAFPSRMTVGMLIESLASKIGTHYADFVDSTPFQWSDERRAVDIFGEKLLKTGQFNRYGSEIMYSALTGDPMQVDIFIGVVYYQRLRHMITDKYQVRAEGPVDKITKQPIKGRKRGGGLRFGEMERDALLAHGAMASLRGRLCTESDAVEHVLCTACGSLLGMHLGSSKCQECKASGHGRLIQIPMVLLVLANDLAAMGVRMRFSAAPI